MKKLYLLFLSFLFSCAHQQASSSLPLSPYPFVITIELREKFPPELQQTLEEFVIALNQQRINLEDLNDIESISYISEREISDKSSNDTRALTITNSLFQRHHIYLSSGIKDESKEHQKLLLMHELLHVIGFSHAPHPEEDGYLLADYYPLEKKGSESFEIKKGLSRAYLEKIRPMEMKFSSFLLFWKMF